MLKHLIVMVSILLTSTLVSSAQESGPKQALLLIDIQEFYFPGGAMELVDPAVASANAARVLEKFRHSRDLIVHIRHNYEPGGDIHGSVAPGQGEKVISKNHANSFLETGLLDYLRENNIEQLVITGMQTHMCVEATTRAASDLGFRCIVISDACTTRNLTYGDRNVNWEDVHYSTLSTLKGSYAEVMTTDGFISE